MKTNRKRVVITGMGILSSLADNIEDFRLALLQKENGITDSARFSEWFENARAAEVLHEIDCPELSEEIIASLDNAALWAYKVGRDALIQAGLVNCPRCLDEMGLIVGVSSAGTEAFLPLFEQRIQDFSLRKAMYSGGFSSCCSSVSTLLGLKGGVELVATACTASPNAVGMAFDYIQNGKSSAMLAVGTEPIYLPTFAGFYALNVMHPVSCSPFSGQSGMSIGEGAGAIALKKVFRDIENIPISSTKSYFGHNIGAAGIVELIACLVTLPDQQVLPTLNFTEARPNCDLDYVPNEFVKKDINIFMKNNYAFGGNNCCMIVSTRPGSVPVTSYEAKRVAITGIGAVSAIGHRINEILTNISQIESSAVELEEIIFPQDVLIEAEELLHVLIKSRQFEELFGANYGIASCEASHEPSTFKTFQVKGIEPRKHLRRFDSRKATRGGTFALIALTEALNMAKRRIKRDGEELGLVMGMARGPQETTYKYLQSLKPDPGKVRTSEFPGSLMNAIATFCGISEGVKGYTTTLATGENAALGALTYGYEIIRQQLQPQVIVGGADEYFPSMSLYMDGVTQKIHAASDVRDYQVYAKEAKGYVPGEGACMLMLEDPLAAAARGAEVLAEVVGYGKSCNNSYFDVTQIDEKSSAMALAIERALNDAGICARDIDLVCGTSNGSIENSTIELNAIYESFRQVNPIVPVVNYNAFFGFVASCAGLLNLIILLDCIKKQAVPAIPYTSDFVDQRINFVRQPLNIKIKYVLLVGATEGGNYYAIIIKG